MANPRDFVPAKYKKPTTDKDDVVVASKVSRPAIVTPAAPTNSTTPNTQKTDSLWSGLASDETSKPLDDVISISKQAVSADLNTAEKVESINVISPSESSQSTIDTATKDDVTTPTKQFAKPKNKQNKLAGILVIFFLAVGTITSFVLMNQNQDNRQQAAPAYRIVAPESGQCGSGYIADPTDSNYCIATGSVVGDFTPGKFGTCYKNTDTNTSGGSVQGTVGGGSSDCNEDDWKNPNQLIAGTYWHCTPGTNICGRYIINIPSTLQAATEYFAANPNLFLELSKPLDDSECNNDNGCGAAATLLKPSGKNDSITPIINQLAPYLTCANQNFSQTGPANSEFLNEYNLIQCGGQPGQSQLCGAYGTIMAAGQSVTVCYLSSNGYAQYVEDTNLTWVPPGTGCGEGSTESPDYQQNGSAYLGDCNIAHFTVCLNHGTGVNGLGCDITTPKPNEPNEPGEPNEPPATTTPPPTKTPTATPTLPPQLVCTDIEMLDASGSAMTGDDDQDLVDGDRVRFRSSASANDPKASFEFRILPPNTYAWINLTDTSAAAAKDVSAFYTIVSSGHHVVQSRLCIDGVCQNWESQDPDPADPIVSGKTGPFCQADPGVASTKKLQLCSDSADCETGHYCTDGVKCNRDSDCASGYTCYQPPMAPCPEGRSCAQVMPDKYCKLP